MNTGVLYIVATPIGNLEDITFRAIGALREADLVVCEDTRVSKKLLDHYEIKTSLTSFYRSSRGGSVKPTPRTEYIISELKAGKNIAFVTDAGTPGISDPGNQIIQHITHNMEQGSVRIVPIPGPSALSAMVSIAGIDMQKFVFLGFPPHKKGRETFFKKVSAFDIPVMYYESPHRLIKNLELLKSLSPDKNIILGRELTKMFEEIVRGTVEEVLDYFEKNPGKIRGEFVLIVY